MIQIIADSSVIPALVTAHVVGRQRVELARINHGWRDGVDEFSHLPSSIALRHFWSSNFRLRFWRTRCGIIIAVKIQIVDVISEGVKFISF